MTQEVFKLEIELWGVAIAAAEGNEVAEALMMAADLFRAGYRQGELRDSAGKTCGWFEVQKKVGRR